MDGNIEGADVANEPAPAAGDGSGGNEPEGQAAETFDTLFDQAAQIESDPSDAKPDADDKVPVDDGKPKEGDKEEPGDDGKPEDDPDKEPDKGEKDGEPEGDDDKDKDPKKDDDKADDEKKESDEDDPDKEPEDSKPEKKPTDRSKNYKEAIQENEALNERFEKLDSQFEEHGGIEVVERAIDFYAMATDATQVEEFNKQMALLPHYAKLIDTQLDAAFKTPAKRSAMFNATLTGDFGMSSEMPMELQEQTLEYIVGQFNDDPKEFASYIERQLDLVNTPEKRAARAEAELERVKAGKEAKPEGDKESAEPPDFETFYMEVQRKNDALEDETFNAVGADVATEYGFTVTDKDPAEIKAAKEILNNAVKLQVLTQMRDADAHKPLMEFWATDSIEDNTFYKDAVGRYTRAFKARTENTFKAISKLLGTAVAEADPPEDKKEPEVIDKIQAEKKRASIEPTDPKPKDGRRPRDLFDEAFDQAQKTATR